MAATPLLRPSVRQILLQNLPDQQPRNPRAEPLPEAPKAEPTPRADQFLNDHGNAIRIKQCYGDDLLYSYDIKRWFVWDGRCWRQANAGEVERMAKKASVAFLTVAIETGDKEKQKFATDSLNANRIQAALASLQCELPVKVEEFDTNPHLLNFQNGTVDLRSGELRAHDKADKITCLIHHNYNSAAKCPARWIQFLERIMGGGPDAGQSANERAQAMIDYLQTAIGYSLTGYTSEKAVFIAYGSGNNGKSTLLDTVRQIIEEYSSKIMIESLMVRAGGESNNVLSDLADLRGARFVSTSETEHGQRLSEGRLKRITQGMGQIKACRKYENPIVFPETHKLWIDANCLPIINGAEHAIWNRLHAIPFNVVIPAEEIDPKLQSKLLAEAEGILAWAVAGATRWYAHGLAKPTAVSEAGNAWRQDMDTVGPFLAEMCELNPADPKAWVKVSVMRQAYLDWCERNNEKRPLNTQGLSAQLTDRFGIRQGKEGNGAIRVWRDIRFRPRDTGQAGT